MQREDSKMKIYHHRASARDSEAWTLVLSLEESTICPPPTAWKEVYNPHWQDIRYFCENEHEALSFARNNNIQILES